MSGRQSGISDFVKESNLQEAQDGTIVGIL
jgi:hypothetical protein